MSTKVVVQTFDAYLLDILRSEDDSKFDKIQILYEPAILRCVKMAFPKVDQKKVLRVVNAVFEVFRKNNAWVTVSNAAGFETLLTALLFSKQVEKLYDGGIDTVVKAAIRKQLNNITLQRNEVMVAKEYFVRETVKTLQNVMPFSRQVRIIAESTFDQAILGIEFVDNFGGFLNSIKGRACEVARLKMKSLNQFDYTDPSAPQITDVVTERSVRRWKRLKKIRKKRKISSRYIYTSKKQFKKSTLN